LFKLKHVTREVHAKVTPVLMTGICTPPALE